MQSGKRTIVGSLFVEDFLIARQLAQKLVLQLKLVRLLAESQPIDAIGKRQSHLRIAYSAAASTVLPMPPIPCRPIFPVPAGPGVRRDLTAEADKIQRLAQKFLWCQFFSVIL